MSSEDSNQSDSKEIYAAKLKNRLYTMIINLSKSLSPSDFHSMTNSARQFEDFGPEAEDYMNRLRLPDSVLDRFVRELVPNGFNFKMARESASRKLFLILSLQNNWHKGLGDILQNTKFYKTVFIDGKLQFFHYENISSPTNLSDLDPTEKEYIDKLLESDNIQDYAFVSYTETPEFIFSCAFLKKRKVYRITKTVFHRNIITNDINKNENTINTQPNIDPVKAEMPTDIQQKNIPLFLSFRFTVPEKKKEVSESLLLDPTKLLSSPIALPPLLAKEKKQLPLLL